MAYNMEVNMTVRECKHNINRFCRDIDFSFFYIQNILVAFFEEGKTTSALSLTVAALYRVITYLILGMAW